MIKMNRKIILLAFIPVIIMLTSFLFIGCKNNQGDLSEYKNLDKNNNIVYYESFDKLLNDVQEGEKYIYFGKPNCPWCQEYLPYFNEYAKKYDKKIYYYNADYVKGTYETINEKGEIEFHVNEEYLKVVNWIHSFDKEMTKNYVSINFNLKDSQGNIRPSIWLFVPKLFKVVDGKIIDCVSEIEGHVTIKDESGNYYLPVLNEKQKEQLYENLNMLFS